MNYTAHQKDDNTVYDIKRHDTYHTFVYTISTDGNNSVIDPSLYTIHVSLKGYDEDSLQVEQVSAYGDFSFRIPDSYYDLLVDNKPYKVYVWISSVDELYRVNSSLYINIVKGTYTAEGNT